MGGNNDKANLIWLFAEEHYFAHKLLALENPKEHGLQIAWWNMCQCTQNGERKYNINETEYALARKLSSESISKIRKGIKFSEEHIKNLSGGGKPVINLTTNIIYSSACVAAKELGINSSSISECCKGKRISCGENKDTHERYIWRYVGEEEKEYSLGLPGKNENSKKKVKCLETEEIFDSIKAASRATGVCAASISNDCCGKNQGKRKRREFHFILI